MAIYNTEMLRNHRKAALRLEDLWSSNDFSQKLENQFRQGPVPLLFFNNQHLKTINSKQEKKSLNLLRSSQDQPKTTLCLPEPPLTSSDSASGAQVQRSPQGFMEKWVLKPVRSLVPSAFRSHRPLHTCSPRKPGRVWPFIFGSVQLLSRVRLFATPWIAAHQASLSITTSRTLLKLMPIELVMPSSHLILCCPLLLLPPIPPSISVFSSEPTLCMRWPKYWSFSFSISPSNEHPGLISFRMDWLDLRAVQGLSRVFSNTTVQKYQFFGAQLSSQSNSHIHTWPLEKP